MGFERKLNSPLGDTHLLLKVLCISFLLLAFPRFSRAEKWVHHAVEVKLSPSSSELSVLDRITLPETLRPHEDGRYHFRLNEGLIPQAMTAGVLIEQIPEASAPRPEVPVSPEGLETEMALPVNKVAPSAHYAMTLPIGLKTVILRYKGIIHYPIQSSDPTSGQTEDTPGIISDAGIFLSGESLWYPQFDQVLMTFSLTVSLPESWHAVSQGERAQHALQGGKRIVRWDSPEPQREIYLLAGKWTEYKRRVGRVETLAYLRTSDKTLANRYLKATEQYIEMYQKLLGPYPYKKFALIENFWESDDTMPSVTLLGPKALRRPLTLSTDYPHKILRNWWGNGVYVDESQGDWSEGLSTYLSEYLLAEQAGKGQEVRLSALQKYAKTLRSGQDFPLSLFQSRYDTDAQAIAYSKTLFLFHMFRQTLGDRVFIDALRTFFHENRFKIVSFSALSQAFSRAARQDLDAEFMQWVERKGAPRLRAKHVRSEKTEDGYVLSASLQQQQPGPAYHLRIPITITLHGKKEVFQTTLDMRDKKMEVALELPARPIRLKIDPEYDLFRRLHPSEMPPTFAKAFAAESTLILLPSNAPLALRRAYEALAKTMQQQAQPEQIEIGWDKDYKMLPEDRSIWLYGWENAFQRTILAQLRRFGVSTNSAMTRIGDVQIPRRGFSLVLTGRHPKSAKHALSWLASDRAGAISRLGNKLPQYRDYGYLAFAGEAARNIEKGRWDAVGSPMSIRIRQGDGRWIKEEATTLPPRTALTTTSPLFSEERMRQDIAYLSDKRLKGRGFGTSELDRAAEYIAAAFRKAGLSPAEGQGRSFLQQWQEKDGVGSGLTLKNVVSILPGSIPALSHEIIVVGAHYDHLGFGWPRVHQGDEGKLHPGANGNASGVALLLELARLLKEDKPLKRSVLFVAFTSKEAGLLGSTHLASKQQDLFQGRMRAMIDLDTVGKLRENRLLVLGTGSSREWPPMLRRIGTDTGVEIVAFPNTFGAGDHMSFINTGIPAIQIFTGATTDTDRPSDTLEKIDLPGMVTVGRVVKELIQNLGNRPTPLSLVPLQKETPNLIWQRRDR